MGEMALLLGLVTLGALVTSLTGLGGGSLILAGLLMIYPPELAIPLHSFNQLSANGLRSLIFFRTIHWKTVWAYAALMLPAAWLGAKIFHLINPDLLKVLVGSFILVSLLPLKLKARGEPGTKTFVLIGALSGFLGIFVGAVGPMVTPFFNRLRLPRQGLLTTKSAGQMLLHLSKTIAFSGAAGVDFYKLREHVGLLIAGSVIGVLLSIPISKKLPDDKFELAVNVLLGLISVKILFEGISGLASA